MLSKLDFAIIAALFLGGTTAAVEASHRVIIAAVEEPIEADPAPAATGCKPLAFQERMLLAQALSEGAGGLVGGIPDRCPTE